GLVQAHWGRAGVLTRLGRHEDALADWDKALEYDRGQWRPVLRFHRALTLARLKDHAQATREASVVADLKGSIDPAFFYVAARVHALSAAAVHGNAPLAEQYAARAVEFLRQAFAKGYKDTDHLKKDPDLDALRKRDDFQKLLAAVEAKEKTEGK